jgi:hypothetical protein
MSRIALCSLAAFLLLAGCAQQPPVQVASTAAAKPAVVERGELQIGEGIRHANLTVFPVYSKTPKNEDRYLTLDEGLKAGTVEVLEVGASALAATDAVAPPEDPTQDLEELSQRGGADVNRVLVVNRSDKPLYLMPGEIIVGGQQDRTIGEEMIIAATGKPVPIDVFCVEHGRWSDPDGAFLSLVVSNTRDVRAEEVQDLVTDAKEGKFVASPGAANNATRLAAQAGEASGRQGKVWDKVAEVNALNVNVTENDTGAFTYNLAQKESLEKLQPYLDSLGDPLSGRERVVGAIVAVNGKLIVVDVFESTPLFRKLWPKLLKGHVLDAVTAVDSDDSRKTCTLEDAVAFVDEVVKASQGPTERKGGLLITKRESDGSKPFVISVVPVDGDAKHSAGFGGGFGGGVHGGGGFW